MLAMRVEINRNRTESNIGIGLTTKQILRWKQATSLRRSQSPPILIAASASSHKWEAYRWLPKGLDVSVLSPEIAGIFVAIKIGRRQGARSERI